MYKILIHWVRHHSHSANWVIILNILTKQREKPRGRFQFFVELPSAIETSIGSGSMCFSCNLWQKQRYHPVNSSWWNVFCILKNYLIFSYVLPNVVGSCEENCSFFKFFFLFLIKIVVKHQVFLEIICKVQTSDFIKFIFERLD